MGFESHPPPCPRSMLMLSYLPTRLPNDDPPLVVLLLVLPAGTLWFIEIVTLTANNTKHTVLSLKLCCFLSDRLVCSLFVEPRSLLILKDDMYNKVG